MKFFSKKSPKPKKPTAKYDRILQSAYQLFLEQGFDEVSIQEITTRANVAKGTFYLYFHDKEDLKEKVITQKSNELFQRAINALHQTDIEKFDDQIIFVIDYAIDILAQNQDALKLIAKNLSFGVLSHKMSKIAIDDKADILHNLTTAAEQKGIQLKNPRILLFMIIELSSSTCFSCILESEPLEIAVFKPYLFDAIRQLIRTQTIPSHPSGQNPVLLA